MNQPQGVAAHTAERVQEAIDRRIEGAVHYYAQHPEEIGARLRQLDQECDIEQVLEKNTAILTLFGLASALVGARRWILLSVAVQAFFLQHAMQGWSPAVPILRRLGVRTAEEIARERYALKAIRGDFRGLEAGPEQGPTVARRALLAVD